MERTEATDEAPVEGKPLPVAGAETAAKEPASSTARRVFLKALTVAALSAIIGLGAGGVTVAVGAFAGCLAAAVYVVGYVRSHVFRESAESTFEPNVTRLAAFRIGAILAAGVALYAILGENATRAYLLALAASWLILVATEAPRALKQLRARGIIG
jgi:hypothetical protein